MIVVYHASHTLALMHNPNISFSCISTQYEFVSCSFQMQSDAPTPAADTPCGAAEVTVTPSADTSGGAKDVIPISGATESVIDGLDGAKPLDDEDGPAEALAEDPPQPEGRTADGSPAEASSSDSSSTESDGRGQPTGAQNPEPKPAPKGARANKEVPKGTSSKKESKGEGRRHFQKVVVRDPIHDPMFSQLLSSRSQRPPQVASNPSRKARKHLTSRLRSFLMA